MSDTTNTTTATNTTIPKEQVVNIREVDVTFVQQKINRGLGKGNPTLRGQFDKLSKDDLIKVIGGEDKVLDLIKSYLVKFSNEIFNEAYDADTAEFDLEVWKNLAQGISVSGASLADLRDRLEELSAKAIELVTNASPDSTVTQLQAALAEIKTESQSIQASIAQKEAVNEKRLAARKANAEKEKASAPASTTSAS